MSINRIQKLLFSDYCDFEDMVLVESPFAQTTREGTGIRQVHLGLTPTKLVLATDVLPPVRESNIMYIPEIDPDIETFQLVALYPVECFNLSIFHRRKRQSLKAHFCNNRILYFELGGFEKRNMFWNLWCERVKFLNPEDPGSSHSETSVATSTSNSTLYLMSSKKIVTKEGIQQLWCNFGVEDVKVPKWLDRYLYMGAVLDDCPTNYTPYMNKPTYAEFLFKRNEKTLKKTKRKSLQEDSRIRLETPRLSINRFGTGIPEGCTSGLFLPSDTFSKNAIATITEYNENINFPLVDYISLTEDAVRVWEVSRDNNPNVHKRGRHRRRYGLAPHAYFFRGLGLSNISPGERYSVQMKRSVSQVRLESKFQEPEVNLSISKRQLVSSISCEALHLDNSLMIHGNGIKTVVKKPIIYFWTPEYWYRPRSSRDVYQELLGHLKKIRESFSKRKRRKRGGSCCKKGICKINYLSLIFKGERRRSFLSNQQYSHNSNSDDSDSENKNGYNQKSLLNFFSISNVSLREKEIRNNFEETTLQDLKKILRMNVALTVWDFDSTTLAYQLTIIDCSLFLKVTPTELAVLIWQKSSKNTPNINALVAFAHRISCLISTEVLRDDSDKIRARLISRLINAADKCYKLSNFQSCRSILCGLQSPAVYRLHNTWVYVRKRHATKYETFETLCRLYRDPSLSSYQQVFFKASQDYPCLPYLGDLIYKLLEKTTDIDYFESWSSASEKSVLENTVRNKSKPFSIIKKILSTLRLLHLDNANVKMKNCLMSYQLYDDKIVRLNKAIAFLNQCQKSAKTYQLKSNELAAEYLLKARYREDCENFIYSFRREKSGYSRYTLK